MATEHHPTADELRALTTPFGDRRVTIGSRSLQVHLTGLSDEMVDALTEVYGDALTPAAPAGGITVALVDAGRPHYLVVGAHGFPEEARIDHRREGAQAWFWSYQFAAHLDTDAGTGRLATCAAGGRDFLVAVENFLRVAFPYLALQQGGAMLHCSGVAVDGWALCFFGHSNAGKSTLTTLDPPGLVLDDDLLLLMPEAGGDRIRVEPLPFRRPLWPNAPAAGVPLGGLFRLHQAPAARLVSEPRAQQVTHLISCFLNVRFLPPAPDLLYAAALTLTERVPVRTLEYPRNPSFWPLVCEAALPKGAVS